MGDARITNILVDEKISIGGADDVFTDKEALELEGTDPTIAIKERSGTPTAKTDYMKLYTKSTTNKLYIQDPDGTEHSVLTEDTKKKSIQIPLKAFRLGSTPPGENNESGLYTLDFDPSTDESIYYVIAIPNDYKSAGAINFKIKLFVDTAPSGSDKVVRMAVEYKRLADGSVFAFSSTTTVTNDITIVDSEDNKKIHASGAMSLTTTSFASGDNILIRVYRDADATEDTFTGDARMFALYMEYDSDKIGS